MDIKFSSLLPSGLAHDICRGFDFIEVAEREIQQGMELYPDHAEEIWNMFMPFSEFLNAFWEYIPALFAAHCREIIDRIGKPGDKLHMQAGTKAEMIVCLIKASLQVPLNNDGGLLYAQLYFECFGNVDPRAKEWLKDLRPSHDKAVAELIGETRRAIARRREISYPTLADLAKKRAEDIALGNRMPWEQYQPVGETQMIMKL